MGQGSDFELMKTVQKVPSPTIGRKKAREVKGIDFDVNEKWDIIDESEIRIPIGDGRFITAKVVDNVQQLDAVVLVLEKADNIAIDCEFLGEKNKEPELKCIQLAPSDRIGYTILVDRIGADLVFSRLRRILTSPNVKRIGWAYHADAAAMERVFDSTLGRTLDLQVKLKDTAGETLNLASAVTQFAKSWEGYQRLIEAKSLAASFHFTGKDCVWLQYPLPPAALVYSVFDVVGLYALYQATSLDLTSPKHFWPNCKADLAKSKSGKASRSQPCKDSVATDSMEEFEFDPQDEDFLNFPRATPLPTSEDTKFMNDLNLAVQHSLQDAEWTEKKTELGNSVTDIRLTSNSKNAVEPLPLPQNPSNNDALENRKRLLNSRSKSSSRKKTVEQEAKKTQEDEDLAPVTHYSLSSSTADTDKERWSHSSDSESKKKKYMAEVTTFNEEEEIEMWKDFAMQRWSKRKDVNVEELARSSQWQSPSPRVSPKDFKSSPKQDARMSPNKITKIRSADGKHDKSQTDLQKKHSDNNNGSLSRDEVVSSDELIGRTTPTAVRSPRANLHPVILQQNQAIVEDNFESDMPLEDGTVLQLHTINSPQRLETMKLTNANIALHSTMVIVGHYQQSGSRPKKLRALQILTVSNDAFTILLDSAIPNPNVLQSTLLWHILTASTIRRVAWEFAELAEHIEDRLGIRPGKTLCLSQNLQRLNPEITQTYASTHLMPNWPHKKLFDELQEDKAALKRGKFVDIWAKPLPPYQHIRAGVLECKAIADMSNLDIFQGKNEADYWGDASP